MDGMGKTLFKMQNNFTAAFAQAKTSKSVNFACADQLRKK